MNRLSTTGAAASPLASPPAVGVALRVCVLVASLSGVAALGLTGLLGAGTTLVAATLLSAAAGAPLALPSPRGRKLRHVAAGALIACSVVAGLSGGAQLAPSIAAGTLLPDLGTRMALLLTGVLVAQLLLVDRLREVITALTLACITFLLALGVTPRAAAVLPLLVAWPAVVTALSLASTAHERARADLVAVVDRPRGARLTDLRRVAPLVALSAVVAVLAVLVIPEPQGLQGSGRSFGGGFGASGSAGSRTPEAYTRGVLDMRARGELPDTPVAEVPADAPRLWRGAVLSNYDGTTWRAPGGSGPVGPPLRGQPPYLIERTPDDAEGPPTAQRTDEVRLREGFRGVLLAPGQPLDVDVQGRLLPLAGAYFIAPNGDDEYPTAYSVRSAALTLDPDVLRDARGDDGARIAWTDLPASVPARVRQLGRRIAAGQPTRYDAVRAVEAYLRDRATYRLDSPVPPTGQDAVDHFLFTAREGFCEHFAAAAVVLLRSAGIPARMATGFAAGAGEAAESGGSADDAVGADGETVLLRGDDAHAWVEVWYPGVGWSPSDPTAGAVLADGRGSWLDRLDNLLTKAQDQLGVIVGLLVATFAVWGLWALARRRRRHRDDAPAAPTRSAVLAAFERLETALERAGKPRAPAESVSELGERLRPSQGFAAALTLVERECYAGRRPPAAETQQAVQAIDQLTSQLLAESQRREAATP